MGFELMLKTIIQTAGRNKSQILKAVTLTLWVSNEVQTNETKNLMAFDNVAAAASTISTNIICQVMHANQPVFTAACDNQH